MTASGTRTNCDALKNGISDIRNGMPPKKLPNSSGKPVLDPTPAPAMKNPMATNKPKNGVISQIGGRSSAACSIARQLVGRQHVVALDDVHDAGHAFLNATWIVVLAKAWQQVGPDDLTGETVRQDRFEAIANFDANLTLVRRDQHEHAVVDGVLSDAPFLEQPVRVLLDRHAVERRHRDQHDFRPGLLLGRAQQLLELAARALAEQVAEVVDVAGVPGKVRKGRRLKRDKEHRRYTGAAGCGRIA